MIKYDVVVIGGGIIGCSVAYYLAKQGQKILLLEKTDHAQGSAGATDGVVSYHTKKPGPQMDLAVKSIEMFQGLSDELGEDIEFLANCGGMQPAEDKAQWDMLCAIGEQQRKSGINMRMISGKEACEMEPMLAPDLYGALYAPCGGKVEPIRLTMAFLHAAKRLGATVRNHTEVTEIRRNSAGAVTAVITADGEVFETSKVVIACGAWSQAVGRLVGLELPVLPRRGQLLVTEPIGHFMGCTFQCARYNIIKFMPEAITDPSILRMGISLSIHQTKDGGLLIGGTREWADFDRSNSLEAIEAIASRAVRFFPLLKNVGVIRAFAGLRPYTSDGIALLGPTRRVPGVYLATGHEGDGIALAPITGKLLAEMITETPLSCDVQPFSPDRFQYVGSSIA
ncbi:FAD-dependent oxidoreductase [Oscillospiraceae bacterium MB08-C2-2]|nr:FAD-dependent oxidoreductase [Oscillospiraceae bacterium MB08-C2-2]